MKNNRDKIQKLAMPVQSKYYTRKYFLSWDDSYEKFIKSRGLKLNEIYLRVFELSEVKPKMQVLDLGCGKGEILVKVAQSGALVEGVDYSKAAIQLAKKSIFFYPKKCEIE